MINDFGAPFLMMIIKKDSLKMFRLERMEYSSCFMKTFATTFNKFIFAYWKTSLCIKSNIFPKMEKTEIFTCSK
jgi:hypothetical protein